VLFRKGRYTATHTNKKVELVYRIVICLNKKTYPIGDILLRLLFERLSTDPPLEFGVRLFGKQETVKKQFKETIIIQKITTDC
jgi:hypothetical protein